MIHSDLGDEAVSALPPQLQRIVREYTTLREALAGVLAWDYLGALVGSLLFPLVLPEGDGDHR